MTVHSISSRPFATTHTTSVSTKAIIFSEYSNAYSTLRNSSTLTAVPKFISHTNFDQFKKIQKTSLHVQDSRAHVVMFFELWCQHDKCTINQHFTRDIHKSYHFFASKFEKFRQVIRNSGNQRIKNRVLEKIN